MKRNLIYIVCTVAALFSAGCSGWLDVNPATESKEKTQFATEAGFIEAMTGVYILLADGSLYGRTMTMELPELLAQSWKTRVPVSGATAWDMTVDELRTYDFATQRTEAYLESLWLCYYKAIMNVNNVLKHIDRRQDVVSQPNRDLIKGEALGLRAFLHFEVLRLWGPAPLAADPAAGAIPYVKVVGKDPSQALTSTYKTVIDEIAADLTEAKKYLAVDPILVYSNKALNNTAIDGPQDEWHRYRQNRFNYYAVEATLARLHMWTGDRAKAAAVAKGIIAAVNPDGTPKFSLARNSDVAEGNLAFMTEHLFAVHNPHLADVITPLFKTFGGFTMDKSALDVAYESTLFTDDIRYKGITYWEEIQQQGTADKPRNMFKKYWQDNTAYAYRGVVPVIRLAELYFMAMEGAPQEAAELFRTFRVARNMQPSTDMQFADGQELLSRLQLEYRKEFYGEGQLFYWFKRHNASYIDWPETFPISAAMYRLPIPKSQTNFE